MSRTDRQAGKTESESEFGSGATSGSGTRATTSNAASAATASRSARKSTAAPAFDLDFGFEPGLTLCRVPSPRSPVVHRLVGAHLAGGRREARSTTERPSESNGREPTAESYWIDAGNVASTHALYDYVPRYALRSMRVGRAFTAYQHHSLVREVIHQAGPRTNLVVAPNVAERYRDGDLQSWERTDLFASTLETLGELGRALGCPVLVTTADDDATAVISERADCELRCIRTREGIRFVVEQSSDGSERWGDEGDERENGQRDDEREGAHDDDTTGIATLETMGYWHGAYWQTTIPYWADICGVTDTLSDTGIDPIVDAHDRGLFEVSG